MSDVLVRLKDVDMVVFADSIDQETVKAMIVAKDEGFFLVKSKRPGATYKILYYALKPWGAWCKVDILLPGILNIPFVPANRITRIRGIPLMPLFAVLLLKLQGWTDHRDSDREDWQEKQYVDLEDVKELLGITVDEYPDQIIDHQRWVPDSMIHAAQNRVDAFVEELPETIEDWLDIGFEVD